MSAVPAHKLTGTNPPDIEAAFEAASEDLVAEILDGELHLQPRPARPHTLAASVVHGELWSPFSRGRGGPGGWVILVEPEIHLGPRPDKVVPDLAAWRRDRMPDVLGSDDAPPYFDLAPDWVCEIISPRTERIDRGKKMRIYRREAVRYAWLINPVAQTLEVYRLGDQGWILLDTIEGEGAVKAEPFDAIEFPLSGLWAR